MEFPKTWVPLPAVMEASLILETLSSNIEQLDSLNYQYLSKSFKKLTNMRVAHLASLETKVAPESPEADQKKEETSGLIGDVDYIPRGRQKVPSVSIHLQAYPLLFDRMPGWIS